MTKHSKTDEDIRFFLSRSTRALHDIVDDQAETNDLQSRNGVAALLAFFHQGFSRIECGLDRAGAEQALPLWGERKRTGLLLQDLGRLNHLQPDEASGDGTLPIILEGEAEIWGALYVIEGSRLGARMMVRASKYTEESLFLAESARCRFWPDFLAALSEADARLNDRSGMAAGAEKAFQAFLSSDV